MPKIGVVGTPGGWSSELLADTVANRTGYRLLIDPQQIRFDLTAGKAWHGDEDLSGLDAVMIKKIGAQYAPELLDRLEALRLLNERGLPMYSKPIAIIRVIDRLACTATLCSAGIPMPQTTMTESIEEAVKTVDSYGEAVFKPLYTSKAKGMAVINSGGDARSAVEAFNRDNQIMYIQKKIDLNGRDLGVVFMGGRYLTTYARCSSGESWNTTTRSGGKYAPYHPGPETIDIAHKAQSLFGLDFTCVDVAETAEGPKVFEVSAFGGFRGIQDASGMDAAAMLTDYILEKIGR
jgi:ribosomal protein S6--L-glutamate ligase